MSNIVIKQLWLVCAGSLTLVSCAGVSQYRYYAPPLPRDDQRLLSLLNPDLAQQSSRKAASAWAIVEGNESSDSLAQSFYVQSDENEEQPNGHPDKKNWPVFSCSFIEFDEHGDFHDVRQKDHAVRIVRSLSTLPSVSNGKEILFLVFYAHGWHNNANSRNVWKFMNLLREVRYHSNAAPEFKVSFRVHGVYLSWRGTPLKLLNGGDSKEALDIAAAFNGKNLVEPVGNPMLIPNDFAKYFTYWDRRNAAEGKVANVALASTILDLAFAAKPKGVAPVKNRVVMLGHSFGALLLERTLNQAIVSMMAEAQSHPTEVSERQDEIAGISRQEGEIPFDMILYLNSAAPSTYAKQMQDYLATEDKHPEPLIISLTSNADWTTRWPLTIGNLGEVFRNRRVYINPKIK